MLIVLHFELCRSLWRNQQEAREEMPNLVGWMKISFIPPCYLEVSAEYTPYILRKFVLVVDFTFAKGGRVILWNLMSYFLVLA